MKYETPELEVIEFEVADVILTSYEGESGDRDENELPGLPLASSLDLNW